MKLLEDKYCVFLNTDDLYDPELPLIRSRIVGGTMVLWSTHLDPYVTIHHTGTSSFTVLILQLPGYQISIHVGLYLPTSGKDEDFITELTNLRVCVEQLTNKYPMSVLYIRGDSNVNIKNRNRAALFSQLLNMFSLLRVPLLHTTYHHFLGEGLYDSDIDILAHTDIPEVDEKVVTILCVKDSPQLLSHHDIILSHCYIPPQPTQATDDESLVTAPRLPNTRERVLWSVEGTAMYHSLVMPALQNVRNIWLDPSSSACMSVLLQMTNFILRTGAALTNKTVSLSTKPSKKSLQTPRQIRMAKQRLKRAHRKMKADRSEVMKNTYKKELKNYKRVVRTQRLQEQTKTEDKLLSVLSNN